MNHFLVAPGRSYFFSLFAGPWKRASSAICIQRATIVMPELNQHKIAGLHLIKDVVPEAFGSKGPAAAPGARAVKHVDACRIEVGSERIAPAARSVGIVVRGRIAHHKERRKFWICRRRCR